MRFLGPELRMHDELLNGHSHVLVRDPRGALRALLDPAFEPLVLRHAEVKLAKPQCPGMRSVALFVFLAQCEQRFLLPRRRELFFSSARSSRSQES